MKSAEAEVGYLAVILLLLVVAGMGIGVLLSGCSYDGEAPGEYQTQGDCPRGQMLVIAPGQPYAACVPRLEVRVSPDGGASDGR